MRNVMMFRVAGVVALVALGGVVSVGCGSPEEALGEGESLPVSDDPAPLAPDGEIGTVSDELLGVSACPAGYNIIVGTSGPDNLSGTAANNCILGLGGNDTIAGSGGDDVLIGGDGNDTITGGGGRDIIYGETGNDVLSGNDGNDQLLGGAGTDQLFGGAGSDVLRGNQDDDTLDDGTGDDKVYGGLGGDTFVGGDGDDVLYGEDGNDTGTAGNGDDTVFGGNDVDSLSGGAGNDLLDSGAGDDSMVGGTGNDVIVNTGGADSNDGGDGTDSCTGTSCEQAEAAIPCGSCATGSRCSLINTCIQCQRNSECGVGGECVPLSGCGTIETACTDTQDNDGDTQIDCADPDCANDSSCLTGVLEITAGQMFSCARKSDGTIMCWGRNNARQLGFVQPGQSNTPGLVAGLTGTPVQVAAGGSHACARMADKTIWCWGSNNLGQAGLGSLTTSGQAPFQVTLVSNVIDVAAGGQSTCALIQGGTVRCWGSNADGQLGNGTTSTFEVTPVTVTGINSATNIVVGSNFACALLNGGGVKCWGNGAVGQLGSGSFANSSTPVTVSGLTGQVDIDNGQGHTCSRGGAGAMKCWGWNNYGQIGNNSLANAGTPQSVVGLSGLLSVGVGNQHSCAVTAARTVECWGLNDAGQVGDGTFVHPRTTPRSVSLPQDVTFVTGGGYHTCARLTDGSVYCWGNGTFGQLGDGAAATSNTPVAVTGL